MADSIIRAIGEFAPGRDIAVGGQDADIAGCQNVVNGKQAVTIYKPITELAAKSAEIAVALARGKSVKECGSINGSIDNGAGQIPVLWLHPMAVTAENMDEIVIKSGFHTRHRINKRGYYGSCRGRFQSETLQRQIPLFLAVPCKVRYPGNKPRHQR